MQRSLSRAPTAQVAIFRTLVIIGLLVTAPARAADDAAAPILKPQQKDRWTFAWPDLEGTISGGHKHGIELTKGADGQPVSRPMCLNLEHYFAKGRAGLFVPRKLADIKAEQTGPHTVRLVIAPYPDWPVRATIVYRLLPRHVIEAEYEFTFQEDIPDFDAFISNYFHEPVEPYVSLGGHWVQPPLTAQEHRYWLRDKEDAPRLLDGRNAAGLAKMGKDYALTIDVRFYDHPVLVSPIGDSGWSVVHVLRREDCTSLSANRTWKAHDFSLLGRDMKKGESVRCRVWMAYAKLAAPADALPLEQLLKAANRE